MLSTVGILAVSETPSAAEDLFAATRPDFTPLYAALETQPDLGAGDLDAKDMVLTRGTLDVAEGGWGGSADV